MLYSQRKRLRERVEAEAKGQSFWTSAFGDPVRMRLLYAATDAAGPETPTVFEIARDLILRAEGLRFLNKVAEAPFGDFTGHLLTGPDDAIPTVIEAIYTAMNIYDNNVGYYAVGFHEFGTAVQKILEEDRVAFEFANGQILPFESKELHQGVVEPAMQLLHNPKFVEAEKAYQHALEEVAKGKPGDAITDAGTALQEVLTALGCDGKMLGSLIKSAKAKGLLAPHDDRMTEAIEGVMVWVAAQRNEKGDSHWADRATKEDAWFIVHVVGALIVRLVGASGR